MAFPKYPLLVIFALVMTFMLIFSPTLILSDSITKNFLSEAKDKDLFNWMVGIRRRLHKIPELLYNLPDTSKVVQEVLTELEIQFKAGVARSGVIGYIGTKKAPFVALRADMDGLPIQEMVESDFKSTKEGQMHACGHDAHVAMLLGAAKILKKYEKDLPGTIIIVFQPAEEGGAGGKKVMDSGVLKDVEAIFGLHVAPGIKVGTVGGRVGKFMAGSGTFEAIITGKGGHAAAPQATIDPVVAAASTILSLQHLISREANPADAQVVSVTRLEGGDAFNVIPDVVKIGGTFRAYDTIKTLKQRIQEVIENQAVVPRCTGKVDFLDDDHPLYPAVINDADLHNHFKQVAVDMLGEDSVLEASMVTMSEDFAFYQDGGLKGYFFFLGVMNDTAGKVTPHNPFFDIAEDAFPYGAALHASLATTYLTEVLEFNSNHNRLRDEL